MSSRNAAKPLSLMVFMLVAVLPAISQSFRVQCPTATITHPATGNNNTEPQYVGPSYTGTVGYPTATAHQNGAIKCQQVSGGDGYATMGDGTQTYMFSFGPLSGLAAICSLNVATDPYHPAYFMINGRSMPDDMDPNYAPEYPHQPYNGNPHLHPGEAVLLRIIGQGRWQHPFHEHVNHVRVLARDGNLILSSASTGNLAGPALFTTTTTPGQAIDGIFYYTGRGLNWDMYGHRSTSADSTAKLSCTPDANGYNTGFASTDQAYTGSFTPGTAQAINYFE